MMNSNLLYLLENNFNASNYVAKYGYSKMLENDWGIECKVNKDNFKFLEYKYKLDKSICQ